jgi:tRNA 2-selenouridine synthase
MNKNLHSQDSPGVSFSETDAFESVRFIDVRSPSEFNDGCIPNAVSIPLLTDEERATIGSLYRSFGQTAAIDRVYDYFDPKRAEFTRRFGRFSLNETLVVYCARGGMRSRVITAFLRHLGYRARRLEGGYKAFRHWNLQRLESFTIQYPVVLHGKTGVGKTRVLERLDNALDLEGLARHRGSIFGGIGKRPVTQKQFEAALIYRLLALDNQRPVFIEGESRRIGNINLPGRLFDQMQTATMVLLEAPMTLRVERTIDEYIRQQPETLPQIRSTIESLKSELGSNNVKRLLQQFDEKRYTVCFESILETYYDKKYDYSLKKQHFLATVATSDLDVAVHRIKAITADRFTVKTAIGPSAAALKRPKR